MLQEMFEFPDDVEVSAEAKDLMRKLICPAEVRMGKAGLEDFRRHPFFEGVPWDRIRETAAPYVPEVSSPEDTSNFDVEGSDFTPCDTRPPLTGGSAAFTGHHLPFIGFTYTHQRFV